MAQTPLIIVISNRKGGCFKTSATFHLAAAFAAQKKVLLIDLDPQASLSQSFFGSEPIEQLDPQESVLALFEDDLEPDAQTLIYQSTFENISIVPSCESLTRFNHGELPADGWGQYDIATFVEAVGSQFDVVLIDTPPNLGFLTGCAMSCHGAWVMTPVVPEDYAAQGLVHIKRFIEQVQRSTPSVGWMGIVLAMVQSRLAVHCAYEKTIRQAYGTAVFTTTIPHAAVFKEAVAERVPLTLFKPRTAGAKAIAALAQEILRRANENQLREAA